MKEIEENIDKIIEVLRSKFSAASFTQAQIHFAGTQRTGKTTLALITIGVLENLGFKPILIDVDDTRTKIFAEDEPTIGTPLQQKMQKWTYKAIFNLRLPDVLKFGGTPVVTATHSHIGLYYEAERIAQKFRVPFKFIILETPPIEEVARRCQNMLPGDKSDMTDILKDANKRRVYLETVERFKKAYDGFNEPHFKIPQRSILEMSEQAIDFILQ